MRKLLGCAWAGLCLAWFSGFTGCGGSDENLGEVYGVVKLDGQPLPDATVQFQPQGGGSPSAARTDSSGNYTLRFSRDAEGAVIGTHTVRITTYQAGDPDADPPKTKVAEKVPVTYNRNTELTKEVTSGSNEINFDLQSGGEIVQPDVMQKLEEKRGDQ